jgi:hypothetical protein
VLRNTVPDLQQVRNDASGLVIKLHGDLDDPENAVITSDDYHEFETGNRRQYFRDKIRQIVEMFDLVVLGHSLSDSDLRIVLKIAKETADPTHPIYLFSPDVTTSQQREYRSRYNIKITSYDILDGTHKRLYPLLSSIDRFIVRPESASTVAVPAAEDSSAATALFLYRRLNFGSSGASVEIRDYLGPLIIQTVGTAGIACSESLTSRPPLKQLADANPHLTKAVEIAQKVMVAAGDLIVHDKTLRFSDATIKRQEAATAERQTLAQTALVQFTQAIKRDAPAATEKELASAAAGMVNVIVESFRKRGMQLASAVFSGSSTDAATLTELYRQAASVAVTFPLPELRSAVVSAAHEFLIHPTKEQAAYLEAVSQGFFLYHLVGCDPDCRSLRKEVFSKTFWLVDSNVVLPLLAKGCFNNEYARDLFARLAAQHAQVFTTEKLVREAFEHLKWALHNTPKQATASAAFLDTALVQGEVTQNLFIDGFVHLSVDSGLVDFDEYLTTVMPGPFTFDSLVDLIESLGVKVLSSPDVEFVTIAGIGERVDIENRIRGQREAIGRYKSNYQVEAEAEVVQLLSAVRGKVGKFSELDVERAYFVSTSKILDQLPGVEKAVTWSAEAVYRFVLSLPGIPPSSALLQQCMLQEFYHSGSAFIDRDRYRKFFGQQIQEAKLSYSQQKELYLAALEKTASDQQLDDAFNKTADLEKPYFVAKMGWMVAEQTQKKLATTEEVARLSEAKTVELELQVKQLLAEKKKGWKRKQSQLSQQEAAAARNAGDPKHVRKRERQAKKRRNKKK